MLIILGVATAVIFYAWIAMQLGRMSIFSCDELTYVDLTCIAETIKERF